MPVRSLTSSVLKWPDRESVHKAVCAWAAVEVKLHPGLLRLGYFGSYARGDWGVGSDLDLLAVVEKSPEPFERRSSSWDLSSLPVPGEIIVYVPDEWKRLQDEGGRFFQVLNRETVWILRKEDEARADHSAAEIPE